MRGRRVVVVGLVTLAALFLSGCDITGSLVSKAGIDLGLQKLTTELEAIPSVTTITPTVTLNGDYSYTVDLAVVAEELVEADVVDIAKAVSATFGNAPFTGTKSLTFELSASTEVALGEQFPVALTADEIANEVRYWFALSAAHGRPLMMSLYPDPDGDEGSATYIRSISAWDEESPDWDALRAVPDVSTAQRGWSFAGFGSEGSLPPAEVIDLRIALAGIALTDAEGYRLDFYRPGEIWVTAYAPANPEDVASSDAWLRMLDALRLVLDAGIPLTQLSYYGPAEDGRQSLALVHFGECAAADPASPGDGPLLEALTASNLDLTAGIAAGWCSNA